MTIIANGFLAFLCFNYIRDKKLLQALDFKTNMKMFIIGSLMASVVVGSIYGLYITLKGQIDLNLIISLQLTTVFFSLVHHFFVALFEEALFRGIILSSLQKKCSAFLAVIVSSMIFTLPHIIHKPAPVELLSIFLGGCLLASLVVKNRSLGAALGFHMMWNLLTLELPNQFLWDVISVGVLFLSICVFYAFQWFNVMSQSRNLGREHV